jgi:hypothetical protein
MDDKLRASPGDLPVPVEISALEGASWALCLVLDTEMGSAELLATCCPRPCWDTGEHIEVLACRDKHCLVVRQNTGDGVLTGATALVAGTFLTSVTEAVDFSVSKPRLQDSTLFPLSPMLL